MVPNSYVSHVVKHNRYAACAGLPVPGELEQGKASTQATLPQVGQRPWRKMQQPAPAELDTGSQWAHRQRELLSRRLYLKDFWYAAGGAAATSWRPKPSAISIWEIWWACKRRSFGRFFAG